MPQCRRRPWWRRASKATRRASRRCSRRALSPTRSGRTSPPSSGRASKGTVPAWTNAIEAAAGCAHCRSARARRATRRTACCRLRCATRARGAGSSRSTHCQPPMDRAARLLGRPGAARSGSAPACSRPSRGGVSTPIAARSSSSAIRAWWGWEAPFVPTSGQSTGRGRGPGCPSAQSRRSRYAAGCDFDARARVVLTSTAECALLGMYHTHARALLPAHVDCVAAAPPRPAQAPPHPHPLAPVWPARINSEL